MLSCNAGSWCSVTNHELINKGVVFLHHWSLHRLEACNIVLLLIIINTAKLEHHIISHYQYNKGTVFFQCWCGSIWDLHCSGSHTVQHTYLWLCRYIWYCVRDAARACVDGSDRAAVYMHTPVPSCSVGGERKWTLGNRNTR